MRKQDSKLGQLSFRDLQSGLIYVIIAVWPAFISMLPQVESLLSEAIDPRIAAMIVTMVWVLLKKLLTDYSK